MLIRNPKASQVGESPYEPDFIEVDLFDAIERYVEAKIVCSKEGADCSDELERIRAESILRSVLQVIEVLIKV